MHGVYRSFTLTASQQDRGGAQVGTVLACVPLPAHQPTGWRAGRVTRRWRGACARPPVGLGPSVVWAHAAGGQSGWPAANTPTPTSPAPVHA